MAIAEICEIHHLWIRGGLRVLKSCNLTAQTRRQGLFVAKK